MFREIATYSFDGEAFLTLQEHRCENHKSSNVKVAFFFPNNTSTLQLMDQSTITIYQDIFAVRQEMLLF
jgi:hypothetical protein